MRARLARLLLSAALVLLSTEPVFAAEGDPTAAAQGAAVKWLDLVDHGRYAESWDEAAAYFRGAIAKPAWEASLKGVRAPLGAVSARTLVSAVRKTALPGVPDGEYVVIQYETRFEHKSSAVETVTPVKEQDGTWKISGYFVK